MTATVMAMRRTRATWYGHRPAIIGILAVFAVATLFLIVQGALLRSATYAIGAEGYRVLTGYVPLFQFGDAAFIERSLYLIPLVTAVFAGVPWLTREFETGSFRYTWVQGIGRTEWLLGTFGPLAATAALAAAACGFAAQWWYHFAQSSAGQAPFGGWAWADFGLAPDTLIGLTLLAMSLALFAGVAIRRTVPAIAACAVACVTCFTLALWPLRDWLVFLAPIVTRRLYNYGGSTFGDGGTPRWNDLYLRGWLTGPDGRPANGAVLTKLSSRWRADTWLAQHHYTYWIAYQPHDRIWLFQLATAAVLVLASAAVVLMATWLLRTHPPQ
jgi:hypothetical protein